jgi:hypothetical protein
MRELRMEGYHFFYLLIPFEPGEREKENPGKSGVCLSAVKRSEFSRGPDFTNERTNPKGGFTGVPFLWSFLWASKERTIYYITDIIFVSLVSRKG